jgi:FkbH-like protein
VVASSAGAQDLVSIEAVKEQAAATTVVRWALLSNTTQEPLRPFLKERCLEIGYAADVWVGGYDTALQDAASAECAAADVIVVALRLHVLAPPLVDRFLALTPEQIEAEARNARDYVLSVVADVRRRSTGVILVHSFETPAYPELGILDSRTSHGQINTIRRLNLEMAERLEREPGVYIVDLDTIRARVAGAGFVDPRMWHIGRVPYTRQAMRAIVDEYMTVVRAAKGRNRKCVVVDADGTLWGGIVGEDGVDGVRIGRTFPGSAYYEFQQALLALRDRGIVLALCSKNDPAAVAEVFAARAADMPLRLEHFAAVRVNWTDKAQNIREIAGELNLGLDSVVFVDDSAFETALVRDVLPAVHTIQLPEDPVNFRDTLAACRLFDALTFSDEDRRRSDMYAAERQRRLEQESAASISVEAYLRGLAMEVAIEHVDARSLARVAQLTQKTNQFNLTTRRYTESDIQRFASDGHDVFALRLRDRLGDSGIVGVAIVRHAGERSEIDTLLMSCRALGRGVEDALLAACLRASRQHGAHAVVGEFLPTAKNQRAAGFYESQQFLANGSGTFERALNDAAIVFPPHFKSITIDGEQVA